MDLAKSFGATITLPQQNLSAIPNIVLLNETLSPEQKEAYRLQLEEETDQSVWTNDERSFFLLALLPLQKQKILRSGYARFIGAVSVDTEQLRKLMEGDLSGV